jgi:hypothetical protein
VPASFVVLNEAENLEPAICRVSIFECGLPRSQGYALAESIGRNRFFCFGKSAARLSQENANRKNGHRFPKNISAGKIKNNS